MKFQFPFLKRELRQLFRRTRPLWVWSLGLAFGLICSTQLFLKVGPFLPHARRWPNEVLYLLLPIHALLCFVAGAYGGNRIFAEEHRRDTLDGLMLLPLRPWRLLIEKVSFPLALALLTWAAGLPVYLLAWQFGCANGMTAFQLSLICLAAGWGVVPVILLLPPDYRERLHRLGTGGGRHELELDGDFQIRGLLLMSLFMALMAVAVYRVAGRSTGVAPFYEWTLPEWQAWTVAVVPLVAAGLASGIAVLDSEAWDRRAGVFRVFALVVLFAVGLGLFWQSLPWWTRLAVTLFFAFALLHAYRHRGKRREDALTDGEVDWFRRHWDNAVLVRDLRVYGRFASIRRAVLMRGLVAALLLAVQAWGFNWILERRLDPLPHPIGWAIGLSVVGVLALMPSIQASQSWLRERTAHTMAMLTLTPLRPEEMFRGRLVAAALHYGISFAPVLALGAFLLWAALQQGYWSAGPALLAFSPLALTLVLAVESYERPESHHRPSVEAGMAAQFLVLVQFGCIMASLGLALLAPELRMPPEWAWLGALAIFAVAAASGVMAYHLRLAQIRALSVAETD